MPLPVGWPSGHHGVLKDTLQFDLLFGNRLKLIITLPDARRRIGERCQTGGNRQVAQDRQAGRSPA